MYYDLTRGKISRSLILFALPMIAGNLLQQFYNIADTLIVGRVLGSNALAAVGSTGIISYFVLCFVQGLTGGFGICLGQCCGAGDETGMPARPAGARLDADAGGHLRRRLCLSFRDTARYRRDGFL